MAHATGSANPNIVFFLVDDMGWQETSVPFHTETTALNRRYRTPNMERLATSGMKFTQAYASAVCSPTRVSALTGLTEALTLEAIKAVENAVADRQPFFLYMAHYAIHAPWEQDNRFDPRLTGS